MAVTNYIYALMTDRRQGPLDAVAKFFLWLLSLGYGAAARGTQALYALKILPSFRPPKPVISVGNITVGGAGKTPLVLAIVQALMARQLRVAILTRGHMPAGQNTFSDEARMLQERLPDVPVLTGADRRTSIQEFLKNHVVDVFVCDDALQHWPLQRDLDVAVIDAVNPFGNGHLLPRGVLREPLSALKRAQIMVLTKTDHPKANPEDLRRKLYSINPQALIVESRHVSRHCVDVYQKTVYDLSHLSGLSVVGFCAIGDPNSFRQNLEETGLKVANIFGFMDHHVYTEQDLAMVRRWAQDNSVQVVVTTHKDAVKLAAFEKFWQGFRVYYLQIELEITHGKNVFLDRIVSAAGH